ncbi:MAG: hypothetical protein HZA90_04585 [Verrucomicrobia bacterium]|nr:hypothetical protein [Verrucomicrobiota bacterium]
MKTIRHFLHTLSGRTLSSLAFTTPFVWALTVQPAPAQGDVLPVRHDPLVRMPGTQPHQVTLQNSADCYSCHGEGRKDWTTTQPDARGRTDYAEYLIYKAWQGSMMGNSARDPLMFACLTVAAQDSMHVLGNPNAVDICLRCHFPKGWLEGRSDPPNAMAMHGEDYDGIQCTFCHRLSDPHFRDTFLGKRESRDWTVYWDEQNSHRVPPGFRSRSRAVDTLLADMDMAKTIRLFSGDRFYVGLSPISRHYDESAGGQYFVSPAPEPRGPFADIGTHGEKPGHDTLYSRYHKGKSFCGTCHDVSNPVLANLNAGDTRPGDKGVLPTEVSPAYAYGHVERTFSEFRLSAYNAPGGAEGKGPFRPNSPSRTFPPNGWETDQPGNRITKCQDCHMCSRWSIGSNDPKSPVRPEQSLEHTNTWLPCHAMTGANVWMTTLLSSIAPDSPQPDEGNVSLLVNRADEITMDPRQGTWQSLRPGQLDPSLQPPSISAALDLAASRIRGVLHNAASITDLSYNPSSGRLVFRIQNQTGHKLISGFPEGRRMFVNVQVYANDTLLHEINPYDDTVGTLKGLPHAPSSPPLASHEAYEDSLVYEVAMSSAITGEQKTFHMALATARHKDNRIPPKGFRVSEAKARLCEPVWEGQSAPHYFTKAEYAGGYDEVMLQLPRGATAISVNLYYQTTSREYIEFLRDEINGTGQTTLPSGAYIAQSHPFFGKLKAWGDTIFQLWERNKDKDGGKPFLMTQGLWSAQ